MMFAKLFAPTAGSSLLSFALLLAVNSFANAADVSSAVSTDVSSAFHRRLATSDLNYGDIINLKNNAMDARWLSGARTGGNEGVKTEDPNGAYHGSPTYEQDRIATYQWTIQRDPSDTGSGCVEYGGTIYLKNNYMEGRWLTGGRASGNVKVFTSDYFSGNEAGPSYAWTVQRSVDDSGSGCVQQYDPIILKLNSMDNRWLTGARTGGNRVVETRDINGSYYEQGALATYQWIVQFDNPPTLAPTTSPTAATLAPTTAAPTQRCGNGDDIALVQEQVKCPGSPRLFRTDDNAPLSKEECAQMCENNSECKFFSLGVRGQSNWRGVCIGCPAAADGKFEVEYSFDTYEVCKTAAPTASPTAAPTPGGACYNLEETYIANEGTSWCYKVQTGKGSNEFLARRGSSDCKARFDEASADEWLIGNAALGQYHYTDGDIFGNKPREGTVTFIEEDRIDTVGTATQKITDGVAFYEITIRRPPCTTSAPTVAPTIAATPEITASQGNTRTISAQGDPIILGLKGQVFKFDGRDGGWYSNIASKSFNWNMQFKEYPTCKEGSDIFISGISLLTSKDSNKHQTSESNILIATTPYQIEECRGDDKNCLGDGTLHISFDGGKSYVSNPGDYHYASRNRVVAHNTYGACSRRWYDYDITTKQSRFSRLGGRRVTVEEKKPFELLMEKAEAMINPDECLQWIQERKSKDDLFEQKGLWSTVHVQTPSVSFHIEYRQSNPEKSDKECDFQSLDAWMVTVSKDLEEESWEGILGETKEKIYDETGHQVMTDRDVLLRGKNDVDYEVNGPFGTTFNAQQKRTSILPW